MSDYSRTPNYGLYLPIMDADDDVWGDHLNANTAALDTLLFGIDNGKYLPLSGGTLTGRLGQVYSMTQSGTTWLTGLDLLVSGANGYLRMPATLEAAGAAAINGDSLSWPAATSPWGSVSAVLVFDVTGRDTLVTAACPGIVVDRYDRVRISAGDLQIVQAMPAYQPVNFGLGGFGRFGYVTRPASVGQAIVSLTFGRVALCSSGAWSPAGCPFAGAA